MLTVAKKIIRSFLMIVTGIVAMMCGESLEPIPNNIPVAAGPPVTEISDEDRYKVLEECSTFVDLLGDLTSDVAQQALVQFLNTKREFAAAGISGKNVWAYFHDGRVAMFIPYWEDVEEEGGRFAMSESAAINNASSSSAGRTIGLPKTNSATLFYGLGKLFRDDRKFLKELFAKSNTNYTVDLQDASIENLKAVKDLGIFYIATHGGLGYEIPLKDSIATFGLWTTTPATPENDKKYEVDLTWYRLIYMHGYHDDKIKKVWHYAISTEFVREYMTFAENAFQYIDACNSIRPKKLDEFREVMATKAANRKATYIGWSAPMSTKAGTPTIRFIFDRLLGAHNESVLMASPVQRPFDVAAIFKDLKSLKLGISSGGGIINYHTNVLSKPILTPSIEYIDIWDYDSEMTIKGLFGENPGKDGEVTVDGVSVPVEWWGDEFLICHLPHAGPGSSGDVVVSVRGNKSNAVPLSDWTIPLNVSLDQLGMTTEAILNLRIRADIHSYRSRPGESPRPPQGDSLLLINESTLGWSFAIGSNGTYSVGGQSRVTCKIGFCDMSDNKTVIPKSGKLPYLATPGGLGFAAYYKWSMDMKKLIVAVDVNIPGVGVEYEWGTVCPGIPSTKASKSMTTTFGIHNLHEPLLKLELTLDDRFTIASGKKSKSLAKPSGNCQGTMQMEFSAQWSSVVPKFAPTKDTEARQGVNGL
jgi:hypothetical protein